MGRTDRIEPDAAVVARLGRTALALPEAGRREREPARLPAIALLTGHGVEGAGALLREDSDHLVEDRLLLRRETRTPGAEQIRQLVRIDREVVELSRGHLV